MNVQWMTELLIHANKSEPQDYAEYKQLEAEHMLHDYSIDKKKL
jgi:hypothetical protein